MIAASIRDLSIVDWQFRAGLLVAFVVTVATTVVWFRRHVIARWLVRAGSLVFVVAFVAATINAHYGYFPTVGALLGRTAADQVSSSQFRRLEQEYGHFGMHHFDGLTTIGDTRVAAASSSSLPSKGVVLAFTIPATVSHFSALTGQVYLPPVWFEQPRPHLPVIELLHGSPGSPADWTRGSHADTTADAYASAHHGFAPIIVMPDVNGTQWWHDSECVDGVQGNAETYLTVDVRNAVVRTFGARADGASWAVAGLSEGGSCALQMALRHPDLFHVAGDFSGDDHPWVKGGLSRLFDGATDAERLAAEQSYDPRVLLARWHRSDPPALFFVCGNHDRLLPKITQLRAVAQQDRFDTQLAILSGSHTFWLWGNAFATALPWMMDHLEHEHSPHLVTARPDGRHRPDARTHHA